jgi:hypothetical protein
MMSSDALQGRDSNVMALIGFLASIRFSHSLAHSGALVIRHSVDAGSPRHGFARVFGELVLICGARFRHKSAGRGAFLSSFLKTSVWVSGFVRIWPRNRPDRNPDTDR